MPFNTGHPTLRAAGLWLLVVLALFLLSGLILLGLLGENTLKCQPLGQPRYCLSASHPSI